MHPGAGEVDHRSTGRVHGRPDASGSRPDAAQPEHRAAAGTAGTAGTAPQAPHRTAGTAQPQAPQAPHRTAEAAQAPQARQAPHRWHRTARQAPHSRRHPYRGYAGAPAPRTLRSPRTAPVRPGRVVRRDMSHSTYSEERP
ncbi:hypothetical protein GCM10010336_58050 [Streptomyces goshikiensis]|nr:hypothetical protein GCM10010336_58050 [Streptomyces goshikiensis]